ncbi:hypothetical protein SEA_BABYDOTZ_10 [Microbacterium phage BabyDotz]|nr:hypothetical protein SEA_BABYDOTZ_10 [Microbacterium phage BabyDotz]
MTDDEREALASFVTNRLADNGYAVPRPEVWLALSNWEALNAPLRRSEEPSAERDEELTRERDHHGIEPAGQGEPSDAQVLAALKAVEPRANWDDPVVWRGNPGWVKTMRAALRAAGGVR